NGWPMISAAQKSRGFPATHEAKCLGFAFSFFWLQLNPKDLATY
ncbi:MAG: hypothetical protein ACJA1B_003142, partial [Polaribacter sp.]